MGLKKTYRAVLSANGPAQHIACAVWGVVAAGLFADTVHSAVLTAWATVSVLVFISVVWLTPIFLKYLLLADFFTSMVVLSEYVMYQPAILPIYHVSTATGMQVASRSSNPLDEIAAWSHSLAIITLCVWSLYLANLVHRQILERKRFSADGL